jgi:hypothetical protein
MVLLLELKRRRIFRRSRELLIRIVSECSVIYTVPSSHHSNSLLLEGEGRGIVRIFANKDVANLLFFPRRCFVHGYVFFWGWRRCLCRLLSWCHYLISQNVVCDVNWRKETSDTGNFSRSIILSLPKKSLSVSHADKKFARVYALGSKICPKLSRQ